MKNYLRPFAATLALLVATGTASAGVVAYYSFDSDFTDGSGNSNNLTTASGTPNITTTGSEVQFGSGALNLLNTENEYLNLGTPEAFSGTDTWSVSFWAKRIAGNGPGMIMGNDDVRNSFIWLTDNFDGLRFRPESSNTASNDFTAPKDTVYNHYVMVADGTGALTLYVNNGSPATIGSATGGTSFTIDSIGYAYDDFGFSFGGQLDEIYIFDEAIDATAVGQLNSNTYAIPEPNTLALIGLGALALLRRRR